MFTNSTIEVVWRNIRLRCNFVHLAQLLFRLVLIACALIGGFSFYYRTTNLWALKNLGDSLIVKSIGRRPIFLGAFHRPPEEQNVDGAFAVMQFLGHTKDTYELYCHSTDPSGRTLVTTAQIESITKAKRAASDVCSWGGFLAECQIASPSVHHVKISTNPNAKPDELMPIDIEPPLRYERREKLVVCVAPLYIYTEWQIMITGIETWLSLGATKLVFPVQSASSDVLLILRAYEAKGIVILRDWPKWPVLSDVNPNGLVLSRGIEESHVNCLHFVKPFAELVAFTDIDDVLIPGDPLKVHPTANIELLEHRDVQFIPAPQNPRKNALRNFNFKFLYNTKWKQSCRVWRMKTRVVVNASRVDSVNMHETGIHRMGYVQTRVPCGQAHFYHLRHSYKKVAVHEWQIDMRTLADNLDRQWKERLAEVFPSISNITLPKLNTESFEDFDRCVMLITQEHFDLRVSRCMTPHVCYSRVVRNLSCVATVGDYAFAHSNGDFTIALRRSHFVKSEPNCEAPMPKYVSGNHFYLP
ncbi:Glycosyltransferase family 92 protein [Aphelenchoides fujianensis]|nr:Glycosyltransferase family 92 protein [Aphelenchoides fujianensis]